MNYPDHFHDDILYYAEIVEGHVRVFKRNFLPVERFGAHPLMLTTRHGVEVHPYQLLDFPICPKEPTLETVKFMIDAMNEKVVRHKFHGD